MKVFIDLGAYTGDTLKRALVRYYPDCDHFIGFEPVPKLFRAAVKRLTDKRVELINAAANVFDGRANLYIGRQNGRLTMGSSLLQSKVNVTSEVIRVRCIDFSKFLRERFEQSDYIILKLDVEGVEYDILEKVVAEGSIGLVKKLFCDWHWYKTGISESRHWGLVHCLQTLGFEITGEKRKDEFR